MKLSFEVSLLLESIFGVADSASTRAELFSLYFASKSTVEDNLRVSHPIRTWTDVVMKSILFRPKVISKLLREIDLSKEPDLDVLKGVVLKKYADTLRFFLARLFQLSSIKRLFLWHEKWIKSYRFAKKKSKLTR